MKKLNFKTMSVKLTSLMFAILLITSCALFSGCGENESNSNSQAQSTTEESQNLLSGKKTAVIDIKDYGKITLELDSDVAPITVTNFVNLANSGFYNGLTFHRIIKGFMMQGGDPQGNGSGGSDQNIVGEFAVNGYKNEISHTRGTISMARSQLYDSASSQFFIVHQDSLHLDGQYAAFGHVTDGMDIVDKICNDAQPIDGNGLIEASKQPVINSITIK